MADFHPTDVNNGSRPLAQRRRPRRDDAGQTTAEYALVLVGVAVVAAAFMTWAGGSGRIAELFEVVMARLLAGV